MKYDENNNLIELKTNKGYHEWYYYNDNTLIPYEDSIGNIKKYIYEKIK